MGGHPLLTVRLRLYFAWTHRPGGCRCVCRLLHAISGRGVCLSPAEPGMFVRVETDTVADGPLPLCRPCYTALTPLSA